MLSVRVLLGSLSADHLLIMSRLGVEMMYCKSTYMSVYMNSRVF